MNFKITSTLALVGALIGTGAAQASGNYVREARVFDVATFTGFQSAGAPTRTGDIVLGPDGRRAVYVNPDDVAAGRVVDVDGYRVNYVVVTPGNGTYTYSFVTYDNRTAANETRHITAATADAEARVLNDQILDRVATALYKEAPNGATLLSLGNGSTGKNAGSDMSKLGVWGMYGFTKINQGGFVSNFKADVHSGTFGVDYLFSPCFLAGLSVTYSHISNGKYSIRAGKYEHDSYTAALYAALLAHKHLSFDAMLAVGKVHKKYKEKNVTSIVGNAGGYAVTLDTQGPDLTGRSSAKRFVGSFFANGFYPVDKLNLWLRLGYLHVTDNEESFNVSSAAHGSLRRPGGRVQNGNFISRLLVSYEVHEMVKPHVFGGLSYQLARTKMGVEAGPSADTLKRFGWMVGGGFRLGGNQNLTGGVNYGYHKRGNLKAHNVTLDVRYDF